MKYNNITELFIEFLIDKNLSVDELQKIIDNKTVLIPISIFNKNNNTNNYWPMKSIVHYLRKDLGLKYNEIAKLTNRSQKTIWNIYNKNNKNKNRNLRIIKSKLDFPIKIIKNRKLSVMENIVNYYIFELRLTKKETAKILNRTLNTIKVTCSKIKKKKEKEEGEKVEEVEKTMREIKKN